jgi:ABC-type antimicrobial peptide transport system ATPase subunit
MRVLVQFGTVDLAKLVGKEKKKETINWVKMIQCDTVHCSNPPERKGREFEAEKG